MTKLSKTDIENLNRLVDAHGALNFDGMKGTVAGIRKLEKLGLIARYVFRNDCWFEITADGRKALRA